MNERYNMLVLNCLNLIVLQLECIARKLEETPSDDPKKHLVTVEVKTVADLPTAEQDNF